jgi:deoxyribodipyrimidine photo-lyase
VSEPRNARLRFLHECLTDLREQYRARGSDLAFRHGDPREVVTGVLDRFDRVYFDRGVTARRGRERDEAISALDGVRAFDEDGIVRQGNTRENWSEQCTAYFEGEAYPAPASLAPNPLASEVTVGKVEEQYDLSPRKRSVPPGGTSAGRERLGEFVDRIRAYPRNVASPTAAERNCSRLSPYLKFGALSIREVYQRVQTAPESRGREMYTSRLYWNRHYRQKLADWPGWTERSVNPVFRGLHRGEHDPELLAAWKEGRTGFPLVDAAMRALVETGFMNFRMRSMCATFLSYVLREHWRWGADFFYHHLVDADPGINYAQWQSQCGLVGVHPIRVYNPMKQVKEHDPEGEYIRKYVPELAALPDEHLARPEKAPLTVLAQAGIELGEDYPYPAVDYEARAKQAREEFAALDDRAKEALFEDPELLRRASLSEGRRSRTADEGEDGAGTETGIGTGQSSLDEF